MFTFPGNNPFEKAGRYRKLTALVSVIDGACHGQLDPVADGERVADMLASWAEECWARAAFIAGINPPSAVTRACCVDFYRERSRLAS